ncbi:MAG: hypothetical protein MPJ79_00850 [Alphaproteobacteria bacterium]|nr:hypothetical protein [Alphaproteobacteria bacterium]MDA7988737.1 hypothetical protein [Alphaproteobacteria bacterium]MDA8010089.1 hypothetical protein [Alphaproteobacteria bacterium]MDA8030285.1 hypothetical protein [Alphaproteobacteria bacterium]
MDIRDINNMINPAINRRVDGYVDETLDANPVGNWRYEMSDEDSWLYYCCCAFSSVDDYDIIYPRALLLKERGLLSDSLENYENKALYKQKVHEVLCEPSSEFGQPWRHNEYARWLSESFFAMKGANLSFRKILEDHATLEFVQQDWSTSRAVREKLSDKTGKLLPFQLLGFAPRAASMFLRFVGYNLEFATLDRHVVKYMRQVKKIAPSMMEVDLSQTELQCLSDYIPSRGANKGKRWVGYESLEPEFQKLAKRMGVPVRYLDEAVWTEMRRRKC